MRPSHFFKYYAANIAKIVLATQKVRWNSPLNFNDPFDCFFSIEPKFDHSLATKKLREKLLEILFQNEEPDLHPQNPYFLSIAELRRIAKYMPREKFKKLTQPVFETFLGSWDSLILSTRENWKRDASDLRLFCVCETNDNLLLWSHYADNHTGVAFQFECVAELDVPLLAAKPVIYSDEAPGMATENEWMQFAVALSPALTNGNIWDRLVTTKARVWEYEKEWRAISERRHYENDGYEDVTFHPKEISKVFFGCQMTDPNKKDVLSLLAGMFAHVEAYQARQHPKKYQLEFDRIK